MIRPFKKRWLKLIYSPYSPYNHYNTSEEEKNILNIILSKKSLKKIIVEFYYLTDNDLNSITEINDEIDDITLFRSENQKYDISTLLKKFKI